MPKAKPGAVRGRPPKFKEGTRDRLSLVLTTDARQRLERLSLVVSAQVGRRLSIPEALMIVLEESPTYVKAMKAFEA